MLIVAASLLLSCLPLFESFHVLDRIGKTLQLRHLKHIFEAMCKGNHKGQPDHKEQQSIRLKCERMSRGEPWLAGRSQ